jgi:hypothetical protein
MCYQSSTVVSADRVYAHLNHLARGRFATLSFFVTVDVFLTYKED